ncbi:uncharacterized protein [Antedon mediterranea]|uniref:uncharacterized protein n=1 Tax=Antedon mediterranea TaxID=105859 RepID=UPI003AF98490
MILYPTFWFIALLLLNNTFSFPEFIKQPEDESRAEGKFTYFNCMVTNLGEDEYVSWLHSGRKISTNHLITDTSLIDRYSIYFDPVFSTYNLQIKNIQRQDVGIYACAVYDDSGDIVAKSKASNFTVLEIPEKYYPLCSNIKTSYKLNQNIVVVCSSEKTYPLPSLIWKRDDINIVSPLEEEISKNTYKVSYSVIAKKSDNGAIFICELTTSANPSIRRNCSVGPINVLYPPVVRIKQTSDIVLGDEAIFICYSDANPQENIFKWSFEPPINKKMYFLENKFILRIRNVVLSLNDTIVTCEVNNSVGSSYSKLNINIIRKTSFDSNVNTNKGNGKGGSNKDTNGFKTEGTKDDGAMIGNKEKSKNQNSNQDTTQTRSQDKENSTDVSISLVITIAVVCIIVILGLALIPVGYMRYTRRQSSDTISRGRPVSIPDVYFEPRDHIDPMLPQLGLAAPWMRTVGVQVPGECEYDVTYNTQVMPQSRHVYYSQRIMALNIFYKLFCTPLLLLTFVLYEVISFSGFQIEPSDISQAEGELVYFTCIVRKLDDSEYVSWLHNGHKISNNGVIITNAYSHYSMDFDSAFGSYNLRIQNVQRRDKGGYTCTVYDSNDHQIVEKSRTANFTVLEIPQQQYPICTSTQTSYRVGQSVVLDCISEKTTPPALLRWVHNTRVSESGLQESLNGNYEKSYLFTAKQSDNREIFTCELTTSANPSLYRNCSIGPLDVLYAPTVRIEQTRDVILGNEAIFICYSDANPQETTFEWSFDPPISENMFVLENDIILRIKNTVSSLNGTSVICKVTNSIGSESSKLIVNVKLKESIYNIVETNNGKETTKSEKPNERNDNKPTNQNTNSNQNILHTRSPNNSNNNSSTDISISLVVIIALVCIIVILGLALIPVGYMKYTRRQHSDTISRGRPVSIPDVYFEPRDHIDPMLPQLGLAIPWMRTVGVQVPGECEYDATYNTQVMPQPRQVYYTQRMYPASSL